jgi:hypothetical protein
LQGDFGVGGWCSRQRELSFEVNDDPAKPFDGCSVQVWSRGRGCRSFVKAVAIIGGHDAVEEFLAYSLWPLSESCEFGVDKMVTPLSKVVVPMPKVTPIIGK